MVDFKNDGVISKNSLWAVSKTAASTSDNACSKLFSVLIPKTGVDIK